MRHRHKGLQQRPGPQYERLVGVLRGSRRSTPNVPVDERSIKSLRSEQAKLDQIITAYQAITKPKQKPVKHEPQWYGWYVLDSGLNSLQRWARDGIRQVDSDLKDRERKQRTKR
jgi:hypothetical protein